MGLEVWSGLQGFGAEIWRLGAANMLTIKIEINYQVVLGIQANTQFKKHITIIRQINYLNIKLKSSGCVGAVKEISTQPGNKHFAAVGLDRCFYRQIHFAN